MRYAYGVELSTNSPWYRREFTQEIKLNASYQDTSEWTKTFRDGLGQVLGLVYSDTAVQRSWYNALGQLTQQADPDGVTNLFQYNGQGELEFTVADLNANGTNDLAGTDRVTRTVRDVFWNGTNDVHRTRTYLWATNSVDSSLLVSTLEASTDGLKTWQKLHLGGSTLTTLTDRGLTTNGVYAVAVTRPDGTRTLSEYRYRRLTSVTRKDSGTNTIGQTTYAYDPQGGNGVASK